MKDKEDPMKDQSRSETGWLRHDGEHWAVRIHRTYAASPEQLWAALTEPDRLPGWIGDLRGEIGPGRTFELVIDDKHPEEVRCRVRAFEPQHLIELDWIPASQNRSVLRFELIQAPEGTTLIVDHAALAMSAGPEYGAGWQTYLEQLAAYLAGGDGRTGPWNRRYADLLPVYQRQVAEISR